MHNMSQHVKVKKRKKDFYGVNLIISFIIPA